MRSWSKWKIFSRKWKSSSALGPRSPMRSVFWSSATGMPCCVVSGGRPLPASGASHRRCRRATRPAGPVRLPLAIARSRVRHGVLFHVCFEVRARVTRDFPPTAVANRMSRTIWRRAPYVEESPDRTTALDCDRDRLLDRWIEVQPMSAATFQDLRYEIVDHVATITFSRPGPAQRVSCGHDARVHRRAGSRRHRRRGAGSGGDRRGPGVLRGRRHLRRGRARSNPLRRRRRAKDRPPLPATAAGSSRSGSTPCGSRSSARSTARRSAWAQP